MDVFFFGVYHVVPVVTVNVGNIWAVFDLICIKSRKEGVFEPFVCTNRYLIICAVISTKLATKEYRFYYNVRMCLCCLCVFGVRI